MRTGHACTVRFCGFGDLHALHAFSALHALHAIHTFGAF